ncbi:uncharacterized protein DNG_08548 [Cephalotrichum gorgonifer]|uniref:Methyltransferase n=1 Tax=Cephalotrichum gorgonifer TaxID=2041049 RepID=A0AAE8N6Q4_9PEZI|nr:uncharacterized protein DNG_08548 [Cephalotrichum gorgonifer]
MASRNGQSQETHLDHGSSLLPNPSDAEVEVTSDYEPSLASSGFTSIETVTRYHVYENGRRYQSFMEGRYPLPNDEGEQGREEIMHFMVKEVLDSRLYMAPLGENPQKILDLGTGCGMWAIETGDKLPSAHVIGIDLSPIQPYYAPPNVEWKIDDLEAEWPAAYREADFIHARNFLPTISNPAKLISTARR